MCCETSTWYITCRCFLTVTHCIISTHTTASPSDDRRLLPLQGTSESSEVMPIATFLIYRDTWRSFIAKCVNHQLNSNLSAQRSCISTISVSLLIDFLMVAVGVSVFFFLLSFQDLSCWPTYVPYSLASRDSDKIITDYVQLPLFGQLETFINFFMFRGWRNQRSFFRNHDRWKEDENNELTSWVTWRVP